MEKTIQKELVILVRGGCVVGVHANVEVRVVLLDVDNLREGHSSQEIDDIIDSAREGLEELEVTHVE